MAAGLRNRRAMIRHSQARRRATRRSSRPTARCARPSRRSSMTSWQRGDAAVRELSAKFDHWDPQALPPVARPRSRPDRQPARAGDRGHQVRPGADPSLSPKCNAPRCVTWRWRRCRASGSATRTFPVGQRRLLRAGRPLSDGRLGSYERADRESCRRAAGRRLHAAAERRAAGRDRRCDGAGRRR